MPDKQSGEEAASGFVYFLESRRGRQGCGGRVPSDPGPSREVKKAVPAEDIHPGGAEAAPGPPVAAAAAGVGAGGRDQNGLSKGGGGGYNSYGYGGGGGQQRLRRRRRRFVLTVEANYGNGFGGFRQLQPAPGRPMGP